MALVSGKRQQMLLLIGMVPFLVAFAYYQFSWLPRTDRIAEVQTHIDDLNMRNERTRAKVARYGPDLPRKIEMLQVHIAQLEQLIPRREDVPYLINQITQRAQALGVELAGLNPGEEQAGDHYSRQTYEIHVLADYHRIGEYLAAIGSLPRIVRSGDLKMTVETPDPTGRGSPQLRAIFTIDTFIMPDSQTPTMVTANAN
jgi:type IV pilus assembly protein PilO